MEFLELNTFLVPTVRTCQKAGTSVNSSRNYEKVPPMRKRLFANPQVIPKLYQFLSSVEHKTRYSEDIFCSTE